MMSSLARTFLLTMVRDTYLNTITILFWFMSCVFYFIPFFFIIPLSLCLVYSVVSCVCIFLLFFFYIFLLIFISFCLRPSFSFSFFWYFFASSLCVAVSRSLIHAPSSGSEIMMFSLYEKSRALSTRQSSYSQTFSSLSSTFLSSSLHASTSFSSIFSQRRSITFEKPGRESHYNHLYSTSPSQEDLDSELERWFEPEIAAFLSRPSNSLAQSTSSFDFEPLAKLLDIEQDSELERWLDNDAYLSPLRREYLSLGAKPSELFVNGTSTDSELERWFEPMIDQGKIQSGILTSSPERVSAATIAGYHADLEHDSELERWMEPISIAASFSISTSPSRVQSSDLFQSPLADLFATKKTSNVLPSRFPFGEVFDEIDSETERWLQGAPSDFTITETLPVDAELSSLLSESKPLMPIVVTSDMIQDIRQDMFKQMCNLKNTVMDIDRSQQGQMMLFPSLSDALETAYVQEQSCNTNTSPTRLEFENMNSDSSLEDWFTWPSGMHSISSSFATFKSPSISTSTSASTSASTIVPIPISTSNSSVSGLTSPFYSSSLQPSSYDYSHRRHASKRDLFLQFLDERELSLSDVDSELENAFGLSLREIEGSNNVTFENKNQLSQKDDSHLDILDTIDGDVLFQLLSKSTKSKVAKENALPSDYTRELKPNS